MTSIVNESSIWRYRLSRAIRWSNGRITHLKTARAVCKKLPLLGQSNRWQDGASILRRGRMLTKVQGHVCYSSKLVSSPVESLANACHSTCRERMMLQKTARPWSACRLLCHPSAERCRHALGGRRVEEWGKWIVMGALSTSRRSIVSCFMTLYRLASTNVSTFTEQSAEGRVRVCQGGKVIQPASAMATVMSCKNTLIITNYCSQDFWVRILPYSIQVRSDSQPFTKIWQSDSSQHSSFSKKNTYLSDPFLARNSSSIEKIRSIPKDGSMTPGVKAFTVTCAIATAAKIK